MLKLVVTCVEDCNVSMNSALRDVVYTNSAFLLVARRKAVIYTDRLAHLTEYGVGNLVQPNLA